MAESLFTSLLHTLDRDSVSQIATSLGESEAGVARGLEVSIACTLGAIASKSHDPAVLRRILDLLPPNAAESSWTKLATGLSTPGSSWIGRCRQILSSVFGATDGTAIATVSKEAGVGTGTAKTLLTLAGPAVVGFLSRRVQDSGLSMGELGRLLQSETGAIRSALPGEFNELLWPAQTGSPYTSPVIAQSVQHERSSAAWVGAVSLAALGLIGFWIWSHTRRPYLNVTTMNGSANRLVEAPGPVAVFVIRHLPNNVDLHIAPNGEEAQLLGVIDGWNNGAGRISWIGFDKLTFDSGSSTLGPDSNEQLDNVAAILKAYPGVHLNVAGYTDNMGASRDNVKLSFARAQAVKTELVNRGISPNRITAEGIGGSNPASDNSTADARAANRRVSLQVGHN